MHGADKEPSESESTEEVLELQQGEWGQAQLRSWGPILLPLKSTGRARIWPVIQVNPLKPVGLLQRCSSVTEARRGPSTFAPTKEAEVPFPDPLPSPVWSAGGRYGSPEARFCTDPQIRCGMSSSRASFPHVQPCKCALGGPL